MTINHKNYSHYPDALKAPDVLFEKILNRIHQEQHLIVVRRKILFFSIGSFVSVIAAIPAFKILLSEFIESGFEKYFSLLFSDTKIVMSIWQNFTVSLLETLPVLNLIIFSLIVLAFLQMLRLTAKNIKDVFISA